jgi:hypothetical protein
MYPYTKELTLDEALNILVNAKCQSYENDGKVYLTALDYATHILNQQAPPEGYGYASKKLRKGTYKGLPWGYYGEVTGKWELIEDGYFDNENSTENWNLLCFRLTDLARVEEQSEILQPTTCCPKCYEVMTELKLQIADLEAKNKELANLGYNYAFDLANSENLKQQVADFQDRLLDAQNCIAVQEREITKLKNYIINQLLTN